MKSTISILLFVSALMYAGIPAQAAPRRQAQNIVVNSPSEFPALAQTGAEALYLHELGDGRTILYVEDHGGRSLSLLDVTNPAAIKLVGRAEIAAKGPFDFVSDLSDAGVLIRYREGSSYGLLDLKHWRKPSLAEVPESADTENADVDGMRGLLLVSGGRAPARPMRSFDVVDTSDLLRPVKLATIHGVTQRLSRSDTGTIFLLNPSGITVVRRLGAERQALNAANLTN